MRQKKVVLDFVTPGCRTCRVSTVLQQTMEFILSEFWFEALFKACVDKKWKKSSVIRPVSVYTDIYEAKAGKCVLLGSYCLQMCSEHSKEDGTILIICRSLRSTLTPGWRSKLQLLWQAAAVQYFSKISGKGLLPTVMVWCFCATIWSEVFFLNLLIMSSVTWRGAGLADSSCLKQIE